MSEPALIERLWRWCQSGDGDHFSWAIGRMISEYRNHLHMCEVRTGDKPHQALAYGMMADALYEALRVHAARLGVQ